jgi:hypothetical protein
MAAFRRERGPRRRRQQSIWPVTTFNARSDLALLAKAALR